MGTAERGPFAVDVARDGEVAVVRVSGELDLASAPALRAELNHLVAEGGAGGVIVDMAAVEFLDSTGLSVLVSAWKRLGADGRTFVLRNANEGCRTVLRVAGLETLLDR